MEILVSRKYSSFFICWHWDFIKWYVKKNIYPCDRILLLICKQGKKMRGEKFLFFQRKQTILDCIPVLNFCIKFLKSLSWNFQVHFHSFSQLKGFIIIWSLHLSLVLSKKYVKIKTVVFYNRSDGVFLEISLSIGKPDQHIFSWFWEKSRKHCQWVLGKFI